MIDYEMLLSTDEEVLVSVLEMLRKKPDATIGEIQRELLLGYARVGRIQEFLSEVGVYDKLPRKYKLPIGEDGKRHRQYLPLEMIATPEELTECIRLLEARNA